MKTEKILLAVTLPAATALSRFRFVDYSGNVASAGERALGVAVTDFDAGEQASVATHGEILVEAGAAIAAGAEVESDASGRAVTKASGVAFGVARDAAVAAGDIIRVLR
jgi:predicted RecA/RadA family phage recombinase